MRSISCFYFLCHITSLLIPGSFLALFLMTGETFAVFQSADTIPSITDMLNTTDKVNLPSYLVDLFFFHLPKFSSDFFPPQTPHLRRPHLLQL